jgi:hypothetical protein
MLRTVSLFFIAILFAGCGGTTIGINLFPKHNAVDFKAAFCESSLPLEYLGSEYSGGKIEIQRSFYGNGDEILVHEKGFLDDNFIFSVSLNSLVYFGFEPKSLKMTSLGNFHTYFEGVSKVNKPIYIISAGMGVFETFDIFYSDYEQIIKGLAECIKRGGDLYIQKNEAKPHLPLRSYIRSDFGPMLFFKYDVIMSKRENDRYFLK